MPKLIHSITISTATVDGTIIGLARTRRCYNAVLSDHMEAADFDAFDNTTIDGKPGVMHSIITQQSPDFLIPEFVWLQLYDLLSTRLQLAALQRGSTAHKTQLPLSESDFNHHNENAIGLTLNLPATADNKQIFLNDKPLVEALKSMGHISGITDVHPKPSTYNPHYKDSDIPDDIDLHESNDNDIPF